MTKGRALPKGFPLYMVNTFSSILKAIEYSITTMAPYEIFFACYCFIGTLFFVLWKSVWTEF